MGDSSTLPSLETTPEHFECFQAACLEAVERFGLKGWNIYVRHHEIEASFAEVLSYSQERWATVFLGKTWPVEPTNKLLKSTAHHEVAHILLAPLADAALERFGSESQIREAAEAIVVTLEHLICGQDVTVVP